jgi:ABC-2 type transport system permease protein
MRRISLVAWREYLDNVRTKTFWISLLALPLIIALAVLVPLLLARVKEVRAYAVLDHSGFVLPQVEERVMVEDWQRVLEAAAGRYRQGGRAWEALPEALRQAARQYVAQEEEGREEFVRALARGERPEGKSLRQWWEGVSSRELEELDVELWRGRYARVEVPETDDPQAALNRRVAQGELFAYFVVGQDPVESDEGCKYVSLNLTDRELLDWFGHRASEVVRARRLAREGLDAEVAAWLEAPVHFAARKVDKAGGEEEVESRDRVRQWAPVAFVYLLWIAVFTNAQALLTNTVEEKSSRVIEVLLSSVSPFELMAGKIAGMAASGLTVVGAWVVFFAGALAVVPELMGARQAHLGGIAADPLYLLSFVFYFLAGYLLYAALLVGIGSVCNSLKEAQNLMLPILVPLMVPLLAMVPIGQDPNGTIARVLSFVPLFTPFVMMNRAAGPPPLWEYASTTLLMLGSIFLAVKGAARIFRIGILLTGKPPRLGEMVRWLWLGEGMNPPQRESA